MSDWRKATRSQQSGECVEVRKRTRVDVRDSKNPDAGHLTVSAAAFGALVEQVKEGAYDL